MVDPAISTPRRSLPSVLGAPPAPQIPVSVLPALGNGTRMRFTAGVIALLALVKLAVHLTTNALTPYGVHRDELLYMAMGRHLQVWRMDFPPFLALVSELTRATFGDSLVAIRLAPALAGAATLVLAAAIAQVMGGGRTAQTIAATAVLTSPLFLRAANLLQPVVFDQLWWTFGLYALAQIARDAAPVPASVRHRAWADGRPHQTPPHGSAGSARSGYRASGGVPLAALLDRPAARWWLGLGAAVGIGLLTKFSIAFFGVGVLVGILLTPLRRGLLTPWPWLALGVALLIGAPSLVGQVVLDWPVLAQLRDLRTVQLDRIGPLAFLAGQLSIGPAVLLALAGLVVLLAGRDARPFRVVGHACLAAFLALLAARGKAYYAAPVYPALFAAGAVALERATHPLGTRRRRAARLGVVAALVAFAVATLPLGLPILAPPSMERYTAALGVESATTTNTGTRLRIPQDYADMLGWPQQAAAVARAYDTLTPEQRSEAVVLAGNYGQAGAIDFYGPRLGLPAAVSPAGSYWFFGPGRRSGLVAVAIGIPAEELRRYFRRVTPVARVTHDDLAWVVAEERDVPVALCEEPFGTLQEVWPSLRPR